VKSIAVFNFFGGVRTFGPSCPSGNVTAKSKAYDRLKDQINA